MEVERQAMKWADSLFIEIKVINFRWNGKLEYGSIIVPNNNDTQRNEVCLIELE